MICQKHDFAIRLERVSSLPEAVRQRFSRRLAGLDRTHAAETKALVREVTSAKLEYRRKLAAIIGQDGMRRYRIMRRKLSKAPRSLRMRTSNALLDEIGVDRVGVSTQESRIFNVIDTVHGGDDWWSNYVAKPRDLHWYYFSTTASFNRGAPLLLEAGVHNKIWFEADDVSITMADDLD